MQLKNKLLENTFHPTQPTYVTSWTSRTQTQLTYTWNLITEEHSKGNPSHFVQLALNNWSRKLRKVCPSNANTLSTRDKLKRTVFISHTLFNTRFAWSCISCLRCPLLSMHGGVSKDGRGVKSNERRLCPLYRCNMCLATVVKVRSCRCRVASWVFRVFTGVGTPSASNGFDRLREQIRGFSVCMLPDLFEYTTVS